MQGAWHAVNPGKSQRDFMPGLLRDPCRCTSLSLAEGGFLVPIEFEMFGVDGVVRRSGACPSVGRLTQSTPFFWKGRTGGVESAGVIVSARANDVYICSRLPSRPCRNPCLWLCPRWPLLTAPNHVVVKLRPLCPFGKRCLGRPVARSAPPRAVRNLTL